MSAVRERLFDRLLLPGLLAACAVALAQADWFWRLDLVVYDLYLSGPTRPAPRDVLLVAIDEESLRQLGRWPWPRSTHAALIEALTAAGVRAIALDIAFTEPSRPEDDRRLAEALRSSGRVVLPVLHEQISDGGAPVETLPIPEVGAAAAGFGHVDVEVDPDGMVRSVYLKAGLGRAAWSSLALALLGLDPAAVPRPLPGQTDPDESEPAPYFWVRDHRVLVRFAGPPGHFHRASYVEVLQGRVPTEWLRNAYVLVGPTATGLGDQVPTPVSGLDRPMPGIEFNANVLEGLRRGRVAEYLPLAWTRLLTGMLVFTIALGLTTTRRQTAITLAALAGVLVISWVLLVWLGLWFTPMPALVGVALAYPLTTWRRRVHDRRLIERERARTNMALDTVAEGVITADAEGRIDYVNPVVDRWVGAEDLHGRPLGSLLRLADDLDPASEPVLTLAGNGNPLDAALLTRGGARMPVRASVVTIGARQGSRQGIVVALSAPDGTGARPPAAPPHAGSEAAGDEAFMRAPDRAGLQSRLMQMIGDAAGTGRHVAVLVLDIAQLRHVNTAFGRKAGDALLQAVADRLRGRIREREVVARIGSDEFVLLLDELGRAGDAVALATRLIEVFDPPFDVEGVEVRVRATVGVSLYPEHGDDAETLLQRAATAVSWARDHGQHQVQLYGLHMSGPALDRLVLERALQAALEEDQLELVYQPQVEVLGGTVVGVEALVRWRHPQHGQIPTVTVITLAEETGLIMGLGEWVLRTGCRQLAQWRDRGLRPLRLAVNVSPRQFLQPGLVESIDRSLREFAIDPAMLAIEITENVLVSDVDRARTTLEQVKAMGVEIALDDFGVGYSSLGYLSRFPVDCVKIDRSFVDNVTVDGHDRTICLAVLAMAQSMNRRVIAEGVETLDQVQFFASKGCDAVQGYFVSRPVQAAEIERILRDNVSFRTA